MLDLFPKSIWKNEELTWLEPSCGVGLFMIYVYIRLMNGLKEWEKDDKKRSEYIIEKMLYMVEINKMNCDICKNIFGSKINIICNDFLDNNKYDDMKYDCIIGNPPFQDDYGVS